MMKKFITAIITFIGSYTTFAQVIGEVNVLDRDVFYVQYTPPSLIDDDFSYQKWSTKLGTPPIKLNKLALFNTLGLDVHQFNYDENTTFDNTKNIDRFFNINYSLFASYKISEKWSINALAAPYTTSILVERLSSNDFSFDGNIYLERTILRKKGGYFQIALGAGYLTLSGNTQVTPVVHLKSRLNERWSFVLGFPNAYVKYEINKKHSLEALLDLNDFSANHNSTSLLNGSTNSSKAVFTAVSFGMEYNYWIKPSLGIMLRVSQSVYDSYELRDSDNETTVDFETKFKQPFISIGIRFNPIRNLQNSLNPL